MQRDTIGQPKPENPLPTCGISRIAADSGVRIGVDQYLAGEGVDVSPQQDFEIYCKCIAGGSRRRDPPGVETGRYDFFVAPCDLGLCVLSIEQQKATPKRQASVQSIATGIVAKRPRVACVSLGVGAIGREPGRFVLEIMHLQYSLYVLVPFKLHFIGNF